MLTKSVQDELFIIGLLTAAGHSLISEFSRTKSGADLVLYARRDLSHPWSNVELASVSCAWLFRSGMPMDPPTPSPSSGQLAN